MCDNGIVQMPKRVYVNTNDVAVMMKKIIFNVNPITLRWTDFWFSCVIFLSLRFQCEYRREQKSSTSCFYLLIQGYQKGCTSQKASWQASPSQKGCPSWQASSSQEGCTSWKEGCNKSTSCSQTSREWNFSLPFEPHFFFLKRVSVFASWITHWISDQLAYVSSICVGIVCACVYMCRNVFSVFDSRVPQMTVELVEFSLVNSYDLSLFRLNQPPSAQPVKLKKLPQLPRRQPPQPKRPQPRNQSLRNQLPRRLPPQRPYVEFAPFISVAPFKNLIASISASNAI